MEGNISKGAIKLEGTYNQVWRAYTCKQQFTLNILPLKQRKNSNINFWMVDTQVKTPSPFCSANERQTEDKGPYSHVTTHCMTCITRSL